MICHGVEYLKANISTDYSELLSWDWHFLNSAVSSGSAEAG